MISGKRIDGGVEAGVYDRTMRANHAFHLAAALSLLAAIAALLRRRRAIRSTANGLTKIRSGDGPAKDCGKRYMDFQGERRFDKGGGVPDYRNLTVTPSREFAIPAGG